MRKYFLPIIMLSAFFTVFAYSQQGKQTYLDFPEGYKKNFSHYHTMNRAGEDKVAKMYANSTALNSLKNKGKADPGSVVVMEVYKPVFNKEGNPVEGEKGVYKIDKLAAIAVMEKKESWPSSFPDNELLGGWGFTIFKPDMTPTHKPDTTDNTSCVACHTPLKDVQDSLFTYNELIEYARKNIK